MGGEKDCRARPGQAARISVFATIKTGGRMCVRSVVGLARPEMQLAIVRATFQEAGSDIAAKKVQLGWSIDLLGLAVCTSGEGAV